MSNPDGVPEYSEEWLPQDFKPVTFRQLVWSKLKSAPLVGVGLGATLGSFLMAAYYSRLANSRMMNVWLRWRVASQAVTVGAAIYYGGVALTNEKQHEYARKQLVLLGQLPTNTPIAEADDNPSWWPGHHETPEEKAYRQAVVESSNSKPSPYPVQRVDENAKYYPRPPSERMQAAEFAARLRAAEKAHEAEQAAKKSGLRTTNSEQELFAKRMENAYANRPEEKTDRKFKVANKHKLRKEAEAAEAAEAAKAPFDATMEGDSGRV